MDSALRLVRNGVGDAAKDPTRAHSLVPNDDKVGVALPGDLKYRCSRVTGKGMGSRGIVRSTAKLREKQFCLSASRGLADTSDLCRF